MRATGERICQETKYQTQYLFLLLLHTKAAINISLWIAVCRFAKFIKKKHITFTNNGDNNAKHSVNMWRVAPRSIFSLHATSKYQFNQRDWICRVLVTRGKFFTSTCANCPPRFFSLPTLRNALSITHTVVCITTLLSGALARQPTHFLPFSFVLPYSFREPVKLLSRTIAERRCFDDICPCNLNPVMVKCACPETMGPSSKV